MTDQLSLLGGPAPVEPQPPTDPEACNLAAAEHIAAHAPTDPMRGYEARKRNIVVGRDEDLSAEQKGPRVPMGDEVTIVAEPEEDTAPYDHRMKEGEWRLNDQAKAKGLNGLTQARAVEPEPVVPKEPVKDISAEAQTAATRGLAASRINIRLAAQKAAKQLER